jgi:hypothetical protein
MKRAMMALVSVGVAVGLGASLVYSPSPSAGPFAGSDVASCAAGSDCSADTYTASTAAGTGYACSSAVTTCFDPGPGADNGIGTDGSGRLILGTGAGTTEVRIGAAGTVSLTENGNVQISNGALLLQNNTVIYNQTAAKPVGVDAPFGVQLAAKALGTCASAVERSLVPDAAAGGTTGARTRLCLCTSDGAGTPAYSWRNISCPGEAGTTTTCPVCP